MNRYDYCDKMPVALEDAIQLLAKECLTGYENRTIIEKMGNICAQHKVLLQTYKKLSKEVSPNVR